MIFLQFPVAYILALVMLCFSLSFINAIQFGGAEPLLEFLFGRPMYGSPAAWFIDFFACSSLSHQAIGETRGTGDNRNVRDSPTSSVFLFVDTVLVDTTNGGWKVERIRNEIICMFFLYRQTLGHVILSISFTAYIVLAVKLFEEKKLIEEFGVKYIEYQKEVPYQFIPMII